MEENKKLQNCHFAPEQNRRREEINEVAQLAIQERISDEEIAEKLNIPVEEVKDRFEELESFNPLARKTIRELRGEE